MVIGIEEVDPFANALRTVLLAIGLHIADGVVPVAIRYVSRFQAREDGIVLALRHGKGQVLPALCAKGRKLDGKTWCDTKDREGLPRRIFCEPQNFGVEGR